MGIGFFLLMAVCEPVARSLTTCLGSVFAMTSEKMVVFKLLDTYSRDRHKCSVTEMDLNKASSTYTVCFRPIGVNRDSPNRYACRYLHFGVSEFERVAREGALTIAITEKLDKELQPLGQLA
jgi:hypothetical protein